MSDPRTLSAAACEILVERELRKAGIEPVGLRRTTRPGPAADATDFAFDLHGRLEAYDRRWSVLIACCNRPDAVSAADIDALHTRAREKRAASALLFSTSAFPIETVRRAHELRIALFRVVDAQSALLMWRMILPGALPAWVPELTVELVALENDAATAQPLEPGSPELVLRQLRAAR